MQTVKSFRGNARTFLTHMFGRGLDDDRYVIERFRSKADGEIHPRCRNVASKKSRGKTSREIVSLRVGFESHAARANLRTRSMTEAA